jgi:hypothetical protein
MIVAHWHCAMLNYVGSGIGPAMWPKVAQSDAMWQNLWLMKCRCCWEVLYDPAGCTRVRLRTYAAKKGDIVRLRVCT